MGVRVPRGSTNKPLLWRDRNAAGPVCLVHQDLPRSATLPVGSLKPNDSGLFDSLGNLLEWCQEACRFYPEGNDGKPADDREQTDAVSDKEVRVLRGGSFDLQASYVRTASRYRPLPSFRNTSAGFRPARTYR